MDGGIVVVFEVDIGFEGGWTLSKMLVGNVIQLWKEVLYNIERRGMVALVV